MKIGKKPAVLLLTVAFAVSLFVGIALAAPGDKPKQVMILASYSGDYNSPTTAGDGSAIVVTSDKPAIYTVTVHYVLRDSRDYGYLRYSISDKWPLTDFFGNTFIGPGGRSRTFTIAGYGVNLGYYNSGFSGLGLEVLYCVVVQGSADTTVVLQGASI